MSRILLVEDDQDLAAGLLFTFAEEGFETLYAPDAAHAKEAFHQPFDLAVLDIVLPDGSGYDLCRTLRQVSDVPIIFLTSCEDEVNIVMGLDGGADDYVTKPFQLKAFLSRIKAHLRRRRVDQTDTCQAGDVRLDIGQCKACVGKEELSLTVTEFRLLLMLARHAGQILTRRQLLDSLWDNRGDFVDDNTLSVHIRHLREKLYESTDTVTIQTVRGIGYRLEAQL